MTTVASRELKNRLGKYLKLVKSGEAIRVTDRGKPIACLLPLNADEQEESEILQRLVRKGGVAFGTGEPFSTGRPAALKPGKSIAEMVAEDRR